MRKLISAVLCAAMILSIAGCAASESVSDDPSGGSSGVNSAETQAAPEEDAGDDNTPEEGPAPETPPAEVPPETTPEEIDYSTLTEQEIYDLMVQRSLITTGDMTRMANVLKRAENGEHITVSYIGGSITEGYNAGTTEFFAKTATDWLQEQFPNAEVEGVNAGLSGTPSILGNLRLERDILAYDPDIVFVEFAVNDGTEQIYKNAYESLVRTLLSNDRDIAVVLLFTVIKNGHSCQPHMSEIGNNYDLPMISLPNSIGVEFSDGRMTWEDYSDDESHPNAYGHTLIRDFIAHYYEQVIPVIDENTGDVDKNLPAPVFSGDYQDMHFIDSQTLSPELVGFAEYNTHDAFQHGWMYKDSTGGSLSFDISCRKLAMVFKAQNSKVYGDAQIYIDGELTQTISSNMSDGWNNPVTAYIIDDNAFAEHHVEIRVEGGDNCCFFVMAFGVCD